MPWSAASGPRRPARRRGGVFPGGVMRSATQRWWLGLVVAAALVAVLAELRAQTAPSEDALVLEADQALGAAMRGDDKSVARRLLSLQFTFVDADGKIHERKDFLADLKTAAAAPPSDPAVKIYGRIGMVTGHRKSADGRDVFFLDIWAKQKRARRWSWRRPIRRAPRRPRQVRRRFPTIARIPARRFPIACARRPSRTSSIRSRRSRRPRSAMTPPNGPSTSPTNSCSTAAAARRSPNPDASP